MPNSAANEPHPTPWNAVVRVKVPHASKYAIHPSVHGRIGKLLRGRAPVFDEGQDFFGVAFGLDAADGLAAPTEAEPLVEGILHRLGANADDIIFLRYGNAALMSTELDDLPDCIGVAEAAQILGVSKQRVYQLAQRPDFPEPVQRLRATPLWRDAQMRTFAHRRQGTGA